jgi:hypothetical protein
MAAADMGTIVRMTLHPASVTITAATPSTTTSRGRPVRGRSPLRLF